MNTNPVQRADCAPADPSMVIGSTPSITSPQVTKPATQLAAERAALLTEQKNLQDLKRRWERGEKVTLQIGRDDWPGGMSSISSTCTADDAHLISSPLNALPEQNTYNLLMLDIAQTTLP